LFYYHRTELRHVHTINISFVLCFSSFCFVHALNHSFTIRNKPLNSLSSLSLLPISSHSSPSCFCPSCFLLRLATSYTPHEHYFIFISTFLFLEFPHVTKDRWADFMHQDHFTISSSPSSLWFVHLPSVRYIWYYVRLVEYYWGSFPGFRIILSYLFNCLSNDQAVVALSEDILVVVVRKVVIR